MASVDSTDMQRTASVSWHTSNILLGEREFKSRSAASSFGRILQRWEIQKLTF
jgi:hypothetical protein